MRLEARTCHLRRPPILLPGRGISAMRCLWLLNSSAESCSTDLSSRSDSGIGAQPPGGKIQCFKQRTGKPASSRDNHRLKKCTNQPGRCWACPMLILYEVREDRAYRTCDIHTGTAGIPFIPEHRKLQKQSQLIVREISLPGATRKAAGDRGLFLWN